MSFVDITQSQIVPLTKPSSQNATDTRSAPFQEKPHVQDDSLSRRLTREENLFAVLSARSDIDHPICSECASMLLQGLNAKLANATRERDAYAAFLKSLKQSTEKHKNTGDSVQRELEALRKEEEGAFQELLDLEQQKKDLEDELADLENENKLLDDEEEAFWRERNAFTEEQYELEVELSSLKQKYAHDQKQLERLQRTNVYNDTFYISHDGYFGTINGLRLGRLPTQNVEWAEINAAWGQTLLLLQTIAECLSFTFEGHRLRPLGSTSRIEKLEYNQQSPEASRISSGRTNTTADKTLSKVVPLDLYSSGEMALNRVFNHRKFDQGMVAFLDCLSQLGKHVERTSAATTNTSRPPLSRTTSVASNSTQTLRLPYAIEGDKIGNRDRPDESVSIKLGVGFSQDENFTKACKYVLTCCKYLLAHVSNLDNSKPG
ncbi:hypothetical protein BT93_L4758 [Corymbia citriodora subsp. variegata]|uniref:Autophagy-related protein 6 n=1 Tax=Corymbia citriodora subsp. variegata TaxID=360336 RepID=A0A8T0CFI4_CORYI|nr:hypothetical protein BT93_L4758 [Corymbia citriodora subsp. variegata]